MDFGLLDPQGEFDEKDKAEQLDAMKPASFSCKTIAQGAKVSPLGLQTAALTRVHVAASPVQQGLCSGKRESMSIRPQLLRPPALEAAAHK